MAFFGKEYKYSKDENFEEFLKSTRLPAEQIQKYLEYKPTTKLIKNGDGTYTIVSVTSGVPKETNFKNGVEFEDDIQGYKIKSTFTVEGNVVTQVVKHPKGEAVFKREYNGDDLVATITTSVWDGVAKRYYKA